MNNYDEINADVNPINISGSIESVDISGTVQPENVSADIGQGYIASYYRWRDVLDKPFTKVGNGLKVIDDELQVETTDVVEADNTLPVTSAAVNTTVGNIASLLELI